MKFANAIGADVVVNRVGSVPDDEHDARFVRLVEVLTGLGIYGERVGARLAAQTANESGQQLAKLIAALPRGTVGVDLQPSGLIQHGFDVEQAVAALGREILHVHASDAVRGGGRGQAHDVELGRGMADFPRILGSLEEFGYRGWATIERQNSAEPVGEIANAVAFLRAI
jgi:sugar phosphate isomerase/epimerase